MKILSATLIAAAGLVLAAPAFAAAPGDVVATASSSPFMIDSQNARLAFPDELTWQTWGQPLIKKIEDAAISLWKVHGVVPLREGSALVKFGTDPQVYAVSPGGVLHQIDSAALAAELYGKDWSKKVVSLFTSFWTNYKIGAPIDTAAYPEGTLLKYANSPTVYYLTNGLLRPFASEAALAANHFNLKSVITASSKLQNMVGNPILGYEHDLVAALLK
jgi:hypothetical protein